MNKYNFTTKDNYILFWRGHFSNWYPAKFNLDGRQFNCSEQYMMYMKAVTFKNIEIAEKIMKTTDPKAQKALGKQISNFSEETWDKVKEQIVYYGCLAKYLQNSDLTKDILNTDNKILVEASPYDSIWGIGMAENDPLVTDETKWKGQNLLGKVLMRVREALKY